MTSTVHPQGATMPTTTHQPPTAKPAGGSTGESTVEHGWLGALAGKAERRARSGLTRSAAARDDGLADLAGNDYLGLSRHPGVLAAAGAALNLHGLGATASRVVNGSTAEHTLLEAELAAHLGTESALVFSSGYLANLAAVRAVATPGTTLVVDAHAHASLRDACRLAGPATTGPAVPTVVAPHADPVALRAILAGLPVGSGVVVTESVFSAYGDAAPLGELVEVCRRYGATLVVDEAHAVGVLGPSGAGAVAAAGLAGAPDVVVTATLSKALGASGGVVAGPAVLIRQLVDAGRTFVYDTALPPTVAAGARAALRLARAADAQRTLLHHRATWAHATLHRAGLHPRPPAAAILSIPTPDAPAALAWADRCRTAGIAVGCFRPPSTPDNDALLRLTLNASLPHHTFTNAIHLLPTLTNPTR
jgi:8-amino-7-oxononanoate synthase